MIHGKLFPGTPQLLYDTIVRVQAYFCVSCSILVIARVKCIETYMYIAKNGLK